MGNEGPEDEARRRAGHLRKEAKGGDQGNEPWGRGRWGRYGTRTSAGRDQRGTRSEAEEGGWHGDGGGSGGRQRGRARKGVRGLGAIGQTCYIKICKVNDCYGL